MPNKKLRKSDAILACKFCGECSHFVITGMKTRGNPLKLEGYDFPSSGYTLPEMDFKLFLECHECGRIAMLKVSKADWHFKLPKKVID